ncbi:phytyl ester synthase 1, chloroplastic isoform X1 [Typha angustifolia]|uniref:phytyl ester synthase 1, chloroplastic isoform X1 n=1 Tax=Typha angustifolia TaxID=59011 RepID=UPI003C2E773D
MSLAFASVPSLPLRDPVPGFRSRTACRPAAVGGSRVEAVPVLKQETGELGFQKKARKVESEELGVLYDDGYGGVSVKDYFDVAKEIIKDDGGPPRWFCPVECGPPIKDAPLLLFLPGTDGVGVGLILHHKSLGKFFEVRCLHIPVNDRTPFEGLVKIVEQSANYEHAASPNRPIYLVGDSFGGCLALSVAARNPTIDLILILVNPATSFARSQIQPLLPLLENLPSNLHVTVPYLLSFIMSDPVKMAMVGVGNNLPPPQALEELSKSLTSMLPLLSVLADVIPRDALLWRLKLLKSAAAYTNSRLHAVEAEVLLLVSGKDNLLPSGDEADRLWASLKNCRVRYFKDNGHTLLLEDGINLVSIIKATGLYRRSRQYDYITDYLPPTISESRKYFDQESQLFNLATDAVLLSTLNGRIVRGLSGVPNEGPVLLVGNHMLMGLELGPLYEAFLKEKNVILRGMAHPILFSRKYETSRQEISRYDTMTLFGALPVTPINMYRLFSRKSFVLLYPGGAREALHRKGEEYKLFWPDQPEFVRMAARFGATIVPFGAVGEDDVTELVLDYNDLKNIPFTREWIEEINQGTIKLRSDIDGEVSDQDLYLPGLLPKFPGRFYYLFGKPIETRGTDIVRDRKKATAAYMQIKSEIENILSYLKRKRQEDPYRSIAQRILYQASWGSSAQVPTFEP